METFVKRFTDEFIEITKTNHLTEEASNLIADLLCRTANAANAEMAKILTENIENPNKMLELALNGHFLCK